MILIPLLWLSAPCHLQSSPAPSAWPNLSRVQGLAFQELWSSPLDPELCPSLPTLLLPIALTVHNGHLMIVHTERWYSGVFMAQADLPGIPAVARAT